ncbi:hypothetical protein P43SY_010458 [Pythium insidiosum]|uniref:Uncharacterized protein n=1 Tax=Pythium insidiosum TaxID=114742 RepID=A0AAD5LBY4_PYTIN|nr:hypothetical protein P43SY_010458 [Pythium insidiosum]
MTTPADERVAMETPAIAQLCGFVDTFLQDLNAAIDENARTVTGEIENTLHQKLESCGDKKKQARQLSAVVKGSSAYMARVQSAFARNFDKLELYMRRNIVAIPAELTSHVEKVLQTSNSSTVSTDGSSGAASDDHAGLSPAERRERALQDELAKMRLQLRELHEENQRMELEETALEQRTEQLKHVLNKLDFLETVPVTTISPLKRTAEQADALRQTMEEMEQVQAVLEDETRAFKRQKMETRDSFRNLRQRFLARTASAPGASLSNLQQLNAFLSTE